MYVRTLLPNHHYCSSCATCGCHIHLYVVIRHQHWSLLLESSILGKDAVAPRRTHKLLNNHLGHLASLYTINACVVLVMSRTLPSSHDELMMTMQTMYTSCKQMPGIVLPQVIISLPTHNLPQIIRLHLIDFEQRSMYGRSRTSHQQPVLPGTISSSTNTRGSHL